MEAMSIDCSPKSILCLGYMFTCYTGFDVAGNWSQDGKHKQECISYTQMVKVNAHVLLGSYPLLSFFRGRQLV